MAWLLLFACVAVSATASETSGGIVLRSDGLIVRAPVQHKKIAAEVLDLAAKARQAVLDQMPLPMDEWVTILWCDTEAEFSAAIGTRRGHLLAVAIASRRHIYLNGEQIRRVGHGEFYQTLVHEFVHIYIGLRVPGWIPHWLNEGLAMVIADKWGLDDAAALAVGSLFGKMIPIDELSDRFPTAPQAMRQAYRQSRSMTAFLIGFRYPQSGFEGLVADLLDERSQIRLQLNNPGWLSTFEQRWLDRAVRADRIVFLITSGGTLWAFVTILFLYAYLRKRRSKRRTQNEWAVEEEFGYQYDGFDD